MIKSFKKLPSVALAFSLSAAGSGSAQDTVDEFLFNNVADGGLVMTVNASSALGCCGGPDDPREAFGQASGPIEGGSFLFGDGLPAGTDNTIEWFTSSAVQISGLRFQGGANGVGGGDPRRIMQLAFAADVNNNGNLFDDPVLFNDPDFGDTGDGGPGVITYIFAGGPVSANHFGLLVESQEANGGPRIIEIDAVVPEPGSALACALGAVAIGLRRRRG